MKPTHPPYIGVTGFRTLAEVKAIAAGIPRRRNQHSPKLHVGVMMSESTLLGRPSEFTDAFPKNHEIAEIFSPLPKDSGLYRCLHYAERGTTPPREFERYLYRGLELCGPYLDAVQLDVPWPDPAATLNAVEMTRKPLEVILQVGRGAFKAANHDPDEIVARLADYERVIHRVLLDLSMGEGKALELEKILPVARAIAARFPAYGLVFAGGLGPRSLDLVRPLMGEFPRASLDAQARVCQGGDAKNPLDVDACIEYAQRGSIFYR